MNGIWPNRLVIKIMQHGVLSMHDDYIGIEPELREMLMGKPAFPHGCINNMARGRADVGV
jgi:hypothetical protein